MADERHAARTVTWNVDHLEGAAAHGDRLSVHEPALGRRRRLNGHPQRLALLRGAVIQLAVGGMQENLDAGLAGHVCNPGDVIDVRMSEPYRLWRELFGLDTSQEQLCLFTRIDDDHIAGGAIRDEVAVLGEGTVGETDDLRRCQLGPSPPPCAPPDTFQRRSRPWWRRPPPL